MFSPTSLYGTVTGLFVNDNRDASLQSAARPQVEATWEGFAGEAHGGLTRPSCVRVIRQYPTKGTEIRNARQLTILSGEELAEIARRLGIPEVKPEWVGANMVLEGIPDLTQVPPASRLIFDNGAGIVVDVENGPCKFPAQIIEEHHPGHGLDFPKVARGLRGVVAWVERPGEIALGDVCRLHVPPQRVYGHV